MSHKVFHFPSQSFYLKTKAPLLVWDLILALKYLKDNLFQLNTAIETKQDVNFQLEVLVLKQHV